MGHRVVMLMSISTVKNEVTKPMSVKWTRKAAWRRSAYLVRARYVKQIDRFPESLIASQRGVGVPPVIVLPPAELAKVEAAERDYAATKTRLSRWWLLLLLGLTAAAAWFSFRAIKIKRMQENIPTSKTAGIVYGLAEVKGKLLADESTEILTGPLSGNECTWYHYVVEEQRGSGKNKSWHVIQDEIVKRPFYCEDDEGKIRIFPGSAECITQHVETDRVGNRRYTERRLSPGDQLYVLGNAKLDKTTGETLVFGHEKGSPYIIANIPEEEVMVRKARTGMGLMAFSLSMLFVVFVLMYNDLIFLKQRCDRNWANIQVSLKKRANLVPQLEQVVKQYLSHEAELQLDLVALRERRASANNSQNFDDYMALEHRAIAQVRARIEQYPDLEGIDLISVFNRRLIKLENEVALIRAGFNDAVTQYQIRCQTFPDNLFARTFNFPVRDLLHYTASAHRVPNVTRLKSE